MRSAKCPFPFVALTLVASAASVTLAVDNPFSYMASINDSDVLKYNGEYYISGNFLGGDVLSSSDLRSWGRRTHVFSYTSTWHTPLDPGNPDRDIHGTHLRYENGEFHLYAHLEVSDGITHAVSSDIWGPYIEPVDSPFAVLIDSETFKDEDGQFYFYSTRVVSGQNRIYRRTMLDPYTLSGGYAQQLSPSGGWEGSTNINEGPKVFKYRGRYYMVYNAYGTLDPNYALGCVEASDPAAFSNSGKYPQAVISRAVPGPGSDEVAFIGQPWVVEGLNGFERWLGYFGQTASEGRTQRIDRIRFFDKTLFVDGPTNRYSPGYHPGPAKPQYLGLFSVTTGAPPAEDWAIESGMWQMLSSELQQSAGGAARATLNRDSAEHYLFEINLKFNGLVTDQQAGARVYYLDDDNWMIVGLHETADPGTNNFYYHLRENGVDHVEAVPLSTSEFDLNVYHKIRVQRNAAAFYIWLDDRIHVPVDHALATTFGPSRVGLFANNANVSFDGVIYTIGWDEHDDRVGAWGDALSGTPAVGSWSYGSTGIIQSAASGTNYVFKGDLMPEYEFSAQVTQVNEQGTMGIMPVAIDLDNYVGAEIDLATDTLNVYGVRNGAAIAGGSAAVPDQSSYNLLAVKLADRVIVFVDGEEMLTIPESYPPSQVGLINQNMAARYNGILVYRTEPQSVPSPWQSADIGTVGFAGTSDESEGMIKMTASGSDIWLNADGFRYLYQPLSGDGEITARVVHHGMTDWWQKAGVMIREDLTPGSRHASCVLTAVDATTGNATFCTRLWRDQPGGASGAYDSTVATNNHPYWVRIRRVGNSFAGYRSSDGLSWAHVGSPVWIAMASDVNVGLALTAHNNDRITDAVFDHVSVRHVLPAPWLTSNIGSPGYPGGAGYIPSSDAFEIEGSGAEICCSYDQFRFVYQALPADGQIVARVVSLENTGPRAKAGVMIRETLQPGSRHYAVELHASGLLGTNRRLLTDGPAGEEYASGNPFVPPYWLRLTRRGGLYTCEMSPDGENWNRVAGPYADVFSGSPAYIGLLTGANTNSDLCTAQLDHVQVYQFKPADLDGDGDVDLHDLHAFQPCFAGQQPVQGGECDAADLDGDNDVDVDDFELIADRLSGPAD